MGLILRGSSLPWPNFGHVVLARPSPILFYPISSTEVGPAAGRVALHFSRPSRLKQQADAVVIKRPLLEDGVSGSSHPGLWWPRARKQHQKQCTPYAAPPHMPPACRFGVLWMCRGTSCPAPAPERCRPTWRAWSLLRCCPSSPWCTILEYQVQGGWGVCPACWPGSMLDVVHDLRLGTCPESFPYCKEVPQQLDVTSPAWQQWACRQRSRHRADSGQAGMTPAHHVCRFQSS